MKISSVIMQTMSVKQNGNILFQKSSEKANA